MISPTNREVDIGQTLGADEYIGMVRREVMDGFMRDRAIEKVSLLGIPDTARGRRLKTLFDLIGGCRLREGQE